MSLCTVHGSGYHTYLLTIEQVVEVYQAKRSCPWMRTPQRSFVSTLPVQSSTQLPAWGLMILRPLGFSSTRNVRCS
jgi:hypothetical protein